MTILYDHRGHPVTPSELRDEQADATLTGTRSPLREEVAAMLTPERLGSLLRAADEGDPLAYLTLAEEMEERELHYRAVLFQRKMGVSGAQVAVEAASDSSAHREHADAVRKLTRLDAFSTLVFDAQDALGKGFAVLEQKWDTDGPGGQWWPRDWVWRDPRWFTIDRVTLEALRVSDGSPEGEALRPYKFVVHIPKLKSGVPIRSGLARPAAIAYVLKRYSLNQLVRFLEVYGIPVRLGKYKQGSTEERKLELLRACKKIGSDAAAIIPEDMSIEFLDGQRSGKGGGAEGFISSASFWDAQLSKVVLLQTMTADEGASFSQSKTHNTVRVGAAAHDCRMTSATINRDVVQPFIALNYGPQEQYPRVILSIVEASELQGWATAASAMIDRGLEIDQRHVRARLGLPEPEPGAKLLHPPPMGFNDPAGRGTDPKDDDPAPTPEPEE